MNYIKEINAFRNYLKTNPLEAITQALWYVIADYHNSCNWERWITIDNSRLMAELSISEKTLIKHRNKLIQAGLLEYKSQQRKKGSGRYKLLSFEFGEVGFFETASQTAGNITADWKVENKSTVKNTADWKADWGADWKADWKADRSDLNKLNKTKQNKKIYIQSDLENQTQGMEENSNMIGRVFEHWNEKGIIQHRKLNDKIKLAINTALNDYSVDEICQAIDNYAIILNNDQYYWSYKFTLNEFIEKGLDKFLDFDTAAKNFAKNETVFKPISSTTGLDKTVDFNKYEQHEYTDEQLEGLFEKIGEGYF
jgi:hypothetical protein